MIQTTQLYVPDGKINFGVGQPSPSLLPLSLMKEAAADRFGQESAELLLAYGAEQGDGYFRVALAGFLSENYGLPVEAGHLFVTAGASQGLDLICTLFTSAGDTIFVEEPSYFLALRIFADHHLKVISLPIDHEGLIIEGLEEKLAEHNPAFLYTIPTFHNPASVTLSASRRTALAELSRQHDVLIVADEVYHLLAYTTTPPPPLISYDQSGTIVSVGSFSKILAPGLRLGWLQARSELIHRFVRSGLLDSGGGLNPFVSGLVRSALENGSQNKQLTHLKDIYSRRAAILNSALRDNLPAAVTFTEPRGGFFIWLHFPEDVDMDRFQANAQRHDVTFQPGINFSSQEGLRHFARLSFAYYEADLLKEGAQRLARALDF